MIVKDICAKPAQGRKRCLCIYALERVFQLLRKITFKMNGVPKYNKSKLGNICLVRCVKQTAVCFDLIVIFLFRLSIKWIILNLHHCGVSTISWSHLQGFKYQIYRIEIGI